MKFFSYLDGKPTLYLHELLEGSEVFFPPLPKPKRVSLFSGSSIILTHLFTINTNINCVLMTLFMYFPNLQLIDDGVKWHFSEAHLLNTK